MDGTSAHLSGSTQRADGRHDVNRLDPSGLPLLIQNICALQDFLAVGVEHALEQETHLQFAPVGLYWMFLRVRGLCGPTLTSSARLKRFCCRSFMYSDFTLLFQQAGPLSERFPVSTMIALHTDWNIRAENKRIHIQGWVLFLSVFFLPNPVICFFSHLSFRIKMTNIAFTN